MRDNIYIVDINKKMYETPCYKQYDNDIRFRIRIVENGAGADLSEFKIRAFFNKKSQIIQKNCSVNGSIVETKLDNNILSDVGDVDVEFCLTKKDMIVTTFTITIKVEKSINRNEAVEKEVGWDIIKDFQTTLDNAINKAKEDVKNTIDKAESDINNTISKAEADVQNTIQKAQADIENSIIKVDATISDATNTVDQLEQDVAIAIAGIDNKIGDRVDGKLDKTGGTVTGNLRVKNNLTLDTYLILDTFGNSETHGTGECKIYFSNPNNTQKLMMTGVKDIFLNGNRVYHVANKPTAADIGASPSNHNHDSAYLGKTAKAESAKSADTLKGMEFKWEYGTGDPTHIWGTNEGSAVNKVWNPDNITVGFAKLANGLNIGKAPRVSNLNNINSTNFYSFSDGTISAPCNYGGVIHIQWNADTAVQLVLNVTGTDAFWIRSKNNTWSAWRAI